MAQAASSQQSPYVWEGTDKKGKRIKGKMLAVSEAAVKADLRRQGVLAKRVRKEVQLFKSGKKVTTEDIALFARQLATMLEAGIPMVQCFDIIGNGHDKPSMQKLVLAIKADIESGTSLHEALSKHPLYFDDLFVNLVEAGEQAGALETLLDKIATYKEKTEALKKKIKKALFYPAAVMAVAVAISSTLAEEATDRFEAARTGIARFIEILRRGRDSEEGSRAGIAFFLDPPFDFAGAAVVGDFLKRAGIRGGRGCDRLEVRQRQRAAGLEPVEQPGIEPEPGHHGKATADGREQRADRLGVAALELFRQQGAPASDQAPELLVRLGRVRHQDQFVGGVESDERAERPGAHGLPDRLSARRRDG